MRLVSFSTPDGGDRAGALAGDSVVDLSSRFDSVLALIRGGEEALRAAAEFAATNPGIPASQVKLLAPLQSPPRIFCVGLNYRDHAVESKMEIPKVPTIFLKLSSAVYRARCGD